MARSFVVRVNILRWLSDQRVIAMLRYLPFDFGILTDIMIDCWWPIERGSPEEVYETIVDKFYSYDIDDDVIQNQTLMDIPDVMASMVNDSRDIWGRDALLPWCDLIVEIVLSLHAESRAQLYPIFNDVTLATQVAPSYGGPVGLNAILVVVGDEYSQAFNAPAHDPLSFGTNVWHPAPSSVSVIRNNVADDNRYETQLFSGAL
jgi:hypothetical protein